jgi:hypothetical protein
LKAATLTFVILFAVSANAREPELPIPPIPPARPPTVDAPVPNVDAAIPLIDTQRSLVTLDTDINHRRSPTPGMAFAPGASYQLDNDRRPFMLPGIMMHVPIP